MNLFSRLRKQVGLVTKILILAVLLAVGWFTFQVVANKQQPVRYQTAQVEQGTLISAVTATGTIASGNGASITTNTTGMVQEVYVHNGDTVSAGDPIALITLDQNAQQEQTQAWASYLSAEANLNAAKAKMNSLQSSLFTAHEKFVTDAGTETPTTDDPTYIIERADWLQAEADYTNQQTVINQAEAALSSASLSSAQFSPTITAPMGGVVSNVTISPGVWIAGSSVSTTNTSSTTNSNSNNSGQTVGAIVLKDGRQQTTVNLSEIDIAKIKIGQKVTMTLDAFAGKTFTGKVSGINTNGTTTSGVTTYPVTIMFDTTVDHLYPNMAVSATIITGVTNDVLLVPLAAVKTTDGQATVQVMEQNKPTTVTVATGESNDTQIAITSGLTEGDNVITGQTGGVRTTTGQTTSPFGGTGFGGRAGGTGFGGGTGNRQGGGAQGR